MKYDDASWHYGGDFPPHLPREAGATHIAMFIAFAVLNGLGGTEIIQDAESLRDRTQTPTSWFIETCDEKLTEEDLNAEGNAFARHYYASKAGGLKTKPGSFLFDYSEAFPDADDLYSVPDNWATYDRIFPIMSAQLSGWRAKR